MERRVIDEHAERNSQSDEITITGPRALLREQFGGNRDQSPLHGALTNICVIIGFAAFAYTVKYVLRNIAAE